MKKIILSFTMVCGLLICFSGAARAQDSNELDPIKNDILKSVKVLFTADMDKGLESLRGKKFSDQSNGSVMYEVASEKIITHADAQYIFTQKGSSMGLYFAMYGDDPVALNSSLKAFLEIGKIWPAEKGVNPITVKKDEKLSINGKEVYLMYVSGLKAGAYSLNTKENKADFLIGFLL